MHGETSQRTGCRKVVSKRRRSLYSRLVKGVEEEKGGGVVERSSGRDPIDSTDRASDYRPRNLGRPHLQPAYTNRITPTYFHSEGEPLPKGPIDGQESSILRRVRLFRCRPLGLQRFIFVKPPKRCTSSRPCGRGLLDHGAAETPLFLAVPCSSGQEEPQAE